MTPRQCSCGQLVDDGDECPNCGIVPEYRDREDEWFLSRPPQKDIDEYEKSRNPADE